MLAGSLDLSDEVLSWYVALQTGVPFLSVGLRLASEALTTTAMAEDSFSGLCWLVRHARHLGVDPARVALMGDSGVAAQPPPPPSWLVTGTCHLAKQILVYPMLDDRNTTPGPIPERLLTWGYDNNYSA